MEQISSDVPLNGITHDDESIDFITTDAGNADRLIREHGKDFKYCGPLGGWLHWTGTRWKPDDAAIWDRAMSVGRSIQHDAANATDKHQADILWRHGRLTLNEPGMRRMIALAEKDSRVRVEPETFDADPYLLNVLNGTVDLRTGKLRQHDRNDLITRLAPVSYDPNAQAPTWDGFLERVLPSSRELREFVQMATGYSATGDVSEQCMFILYGTGANGKSTYVEAVKSTLGEYAHRTRTEMLMMKQTGTTATPDIVNLKGKRFVFASESQEGERLSESLVKDLTGGDTINGRPLYGKPMEFQPSHKLWLSTNHRPEIKGTGHSIWRRLHLVPFKEQIDKPDKQLPARLLGERSGILNWIVRGAMMWTQTGLVDVPKEVSQATKQYRDDMDKVGQFIEDRCVTEQSLLESNLYVLKDRLYSEYRSWCEENGVYSGKKRSFGDKMVEKGYDPEQKEYVAGKQVRVWRGIGLLER